MYDPFAEFEGVEFPNGLRAFVLHVPGRIAEHVRFIVHAGFNSDPDEHMGLAHFTEHMMCSQDMPLNQLIKYFESEGGEFDAATGSFRTAYGYSVPIGSKKSKEFFNFWADKFMGHVHFKELEAQHSVIAQEWHDEYPTVKERLIFESVKFSLNGGYKHGRVGSGLGTLASIQSITSQDVASFIRTYYVPSNMSIVAVGGMELEAVVRLVEESGLTQMRSGALRPTYERSASTHPVRDHKVAYLTSSGKKKDASKVDVENRVLLPGVVGESALYIVSKMLEHNVIELLRDCAIPLIYSGGVGCEDFLEVFELNVVANSVPVGSVRQARNRLCEVIDRLDDGQLFEQTKRQLIAQKQMSDLTLSSIADDAVDDLVTHDAPISYKNEIEMLERVQLHDVQAIMEQLRSPQSSVMLDLYR